MSNNPFNLYPHILIFDSGVGGLSILREIKRLIPACLYSYVTDNQGFPYGNKPSEVVIDRVNRTILACTKTSSTPIDMVIIACNTASTIALPTLRAQFQIPIIGVVPAVKPAAAASINQYVGLLATPATITRPYTKELIKEHGNGCHIVAVGSTELVHIAEKKMAGEDIQQADIIRILQPFKQVSNTNPSPEKMDHLILACTHFPLLRNEIQNELGVNVQLIDSSAAIANRVLHILNTLMFRITEDNCNNNQSSQLFITEGNEKLRTLKSIFNEFAFKNTIMVVI